MAAISKPLPAPPKLRWWQKYRNQTLVISFLFVLPALINFAVFRYYPMLWAAWASLWEYSLLRGFTEFVGLENYARLLQDPNFWNSLRVTLYFTALKVPLQVALGLGLAILASQDRRGMGTLRAIIFIPVVTSFIVVSIVWGMVLNRDVGLLNAILQTVGLPRMTFLTSPTNALPSLVVISAWKDIGYSAIILAVGLRGISPTFYEAAIVDGANAWQRFVYITIPMLRRALMFVIVTTTIFSFQVFIPVYQLTKGGPGQATNVIVYNIYQKAFIFGEMGYASALSMALLVIILLISIVQMRLLRSED